MLAAVLIVVSGFDKGQCSHRYKNIQDHYIAQHSDMADKSARTKKLGMIEDINKKSHSD